MYFMDIAQIYEFWQKFVKTVNMYAMCFKNHVEN